MPEMTDEQVAAAAKDAETAAKWTEAFKDEDPEKVRKALDHAREWEKRAKDNSQAAAKLAELENATKTEAEKAADQMAKLQRDLEDTKREALKRRVQAAHKISDEDADLFLTGTDEESLTAQAKRLAEREDARTTKGNRVPGEGRTQTKPGDDPMRVFTREVFGREE